MKGQLGLLGTISLVILIGEVSRCSCKGAFSFGYDADKGWSAGLEGEGGSVKLGGNKGNINKFSASNGDADVDFDKKDDTDEWSANFGQGDNKLSLKGNKGKLNNFGVNKGNSRFGMNLGDDDSYSLDFGHDSKEVTFKGKKGKLNNMQFSTGNNKNAKTNKKAVVKPHSEEADDDEDLQASDKQTSRSENSDEDQSQLKPNLRNYLGPRKSSRAAHAYV